MIDGKRIKSLRKSMGLKQWELAEELGVSNRTLSTWECGAKTPRDNLLINLANKLNTSVAYLMGLEDNRADEPEPDPEPPKKANEHAELIHQMAEVYIACVRDLRTQNSQLASENESLRQIIKELREASDTIIERRMDNNE